jgi:hypothetical protein
VWREGGAGRSIRAQARAAVAQDLSRQGGDSMDEQAHGDQEAPPSLSVQRRLLVRPGGGPLARDGVTAEGASS